MNSISWAPHEFGLMLACGSSDGTISILSTSGDGNWENKKITNAHTVSSKYFMKIIFVAIQTTFCASLPCLDIRQTKYLVIENLFYLEVDEPRLQN